jgi:hydrogenase nickel incorporation protein HypB
MCTTCGCGQGETTIDGKPIGAHEHSHRHDDGTVHAHAHVHAHGELLSHVEAGELDWHQHHDGTWHSHVHGGGSAHELGAMAGAAGTGRLGAVHAPGIAPARMLQIEQDILAKNDEYAQANRQAFADRGVFALNLVSSPGAGKTTLLVRTIEALAGRYRVAVIEGDQQTSRDADRIRVTGAPAVQVNTGKACHLDARMVAQAFATLPTLDGGLLFVENVGNLVCPAAFDLGEAHKVVILSVTEGDDKPLKYPDMFHAADLMLVNKVDLLPHVEFDVDAAIGYAHRVRPGLPVLRVSATTGEGMEAWLAWLEAGAGAAIARRNESVAGLKRRVTELEAKLDSLQAGS